ncbi:MAG TPA: type II toxin-antitoxin system VapC family toxin [Thermoanaerobaculia bacterium]|nr:type II toxin-antitoxin system VapC family toxin [Thermoanaerobaculia bacterium]
MNLYAESSAVLAWLLEESTADEVRRFLAGAETVVASELTLVECRRALVRLQSLGHVSEAQARRLGATLDRLVAHWTLLTVDREVSSRAGLPLPGEPLRTLDALHLSSAMNARGSVPGMAFLTLDERLRRAADMAGFEVLPGPPELVAEPTERPSR